jgi:hypothetical protein
MVIITSGMGSLDDDTFGGSIAYRRSKTAVNIVMRSAGIDLAPRSTYGPANQSLSLKTADAMRTWLVG